MTQPLLSVVGLTKHFSGRRARFVRGRSTLAVQAVNDVCFDLAEGETLGLVGETGSGKSTVARLLMGLETPTSGSALYQGRNIFDMTVEERRSFRRDVQMVFQDPYASLSPRMTVNQLIREPWLVQGGPIPKHKWASRVRELLDQVGLPVDAGERYPHEFSGGQRQRIGIARALALEPKIIICDEPVSALDVSIQAQIINLLMKLQRDLKVSYVFIAHDLSVVQHVAHRVAVMYLSRVVELGSVDEVFAAPLHPYTQALLSAIPSIAVDEEIEHAQRIVLAGDTSDSKTETLGCNFAPRCWLADTRCRQERPELSAGGLQHLNACHYAGRTSDGGEGRSTQSSSVPTREDPE